MTSCCLNCASETQTAKTLNPISPPQPQRHGRASWPERESHFHYLPPPRVHIPPLPLHHIPRTASSTFAPYIFGIIASFKHVNHEIGIRLGVKYKTYKHFSYLALEPELSLRSLKSSTFTSFPQNSPHSYSQDHWRQDFHRRQGRYS